MMRADEIFERCREIAEDASFGEVAKWKERRPEGKVVSHFQVYFPEEIAHAGGMLPVTLAGGGNRIEPRKASSRLPSFICSICHTSLEIGLTGAGHLFDAMIFSPICDVARNLSGIWKRNLPAAFVKILYLPQNPGSLAAAEFLASEYRRLRDDLAQIGGRPIEAEHLRESLRIYNENRRLVRELHALKRERPWVVSASEVYALLRAGTVLPKDEHNEWLRAVLGGLPERRRKPQDKVRVVLEGGFCEQPPLDFLEALEEVCYVVDDDLLIGARWLTEDVPETDDPLLALARAYVACPAYSAVQHDDGRPKETRFLEKVKAARAEAVVIAAAKFCEPGLDEQVAFAQALEREGIRYLVMEFEEKMFSFDQVRTQVETFAESILFYS